MAEPSGATDPASYRTIARNTTGEVTDRGSRFWCELRRVGTVEAARDVIGECRAAFADARHHCSAMVIGAHGDIRHRDDDGEPGGTAGAPMLQALLDAGLSDVVAVVTRWFGGTLLGTGGLVRAYSGAVRAAIEQAGVIERARWALAEVELDHGEAGRVEAALRRGGVHIAGARYEDVVILELAVPDVEALEAELAGLTAGAAAPRVTGARWVDLP